MTRTATRALGETSGGPVAPGVGAPTGGEPGSDRPGSDRPGGDGADGGRVDGGGAGVGPDTFRSVFRRHPAGVSVVTLDGPSGPVGFTATSLASLSLEPPLLSLSVASSSSAWPALRAASTVVVHLLGREAGPVAVRFATRGVDRFGPPTRWSRLPTGEPHLHDAAAWLRCRVEHRIPAGDHHLVVARVLDARLLRAAAPLVYHDGAYAGLVAGEPEDLEPVR